MKTQWLFKANFYLYIISARISSLLIYAYRERSGSTTMDLCDLKIYYILPYYVHPSPVKAKRGSAPPPGQCSSLLQNGAVIKTIPHCLIIHSIWQTASWLRISKRWEASWWLHSLDAKSQAESYLLSAQRERPPGAQFCLLPLNRLAPEWLNFPTQPPPRMWYFPDNPEQM